MGPRQNITEFMRNRVVESDEKLQQLQEVIKRSEASLVAADKVAILGRLVSGIMHEINNPLSAVYNSLHLLQMNPRVPAELQPVMKIAMDEADRCMRIARNTLSFTRESSEELPLKVEDLMKSVLDLYAHRLRREHITVDTRLEGTLPIRAFPGEIRQVLANIFGNAIDATNRGGSIYVGTKDACDYRTGATGIRVLIADSGSGISEDARKHLGEPYFTTKGEAGTGLGLWISFEIIKKHHGTVRIRNASSKGGAVFSIFLPTATRPATNSELRGKVA